MPLATRAKRASGRGNGPEITPSCSLTYGHADATRARASRCLENPPETVAPLNKCMAESNKTSNADEATKKHKMVGNHKCRTSYERRDKLAAFDRFYSALRPTNFTTLAHFSVSSAMRLAKSAD